jgi:prepilin-type N-terminal cleavage/methylation domain-containing protein
MIVRQIFSKLNQTGGCMKQFKQKIQEGFTLVEILIVVVIIGILATVAIPTYFSYVEKAYASDAKTQLKNILMNSELYIQQFGSVPTQEDLEAAKMINLAKSVTEKWTFDLQMEYDDVTNEMGGFIAATSTALMGGGPEKTLTFDVEEGVWSGYGQSTASSGGDGE